MTVTIPCKDFGEARTICPRRKEAVISDFGDDLYFLDPKGRVKFPSPQSPTMSACGWTSTGRHQLLISIRDSWHFLTCRKGSQATENLEWRVGLEIGKNLGRRQAQIRTYLRSL